MATTLSSMAKTVQIRVPAELVGDIAIVAAAFGTTASKYAEEVLKAAVVRDLPQAAKVVKDRVDGKRPKSP